MTTTTTQALSPAGTAARDGESFLASTIGRKLVMAVTGVVLFGFVVVHMIGNLQIYLGPEALDAYGAFLRHVLHGGGIWIARATLLLAVGLHIWAAWSLTLTSWSARKVGYLEVRHRESTYASRTMRWSGPILALFVVFHLLHFTIGSVTPGFRFEDGRVYHNVVAGFQVWPVSAFYILAMLALGYHMYHGVWSMTQTLGWAHPRYNRLRRAFAAVFTGLVVVGNISIPVAVLAGVVRQVP
jgi:succinate dehydrogenase / fumarate reductase cytochrome b subunit